MPLIGLLLAGLMSAAPARAADLEAGSSFVEARSGPWEFGIDGGELIPTQKVSFVHTIDNGQAYNLLANELVGDEVGEGWVAPPFPGTSDIAGTIRPLADIGLHAYYRVARRLSWGLDAGMGVQRETHIDNRGIYRDENFLHLIYNASIIHVTAPVKATLPLGLVRAYVLAGPGLYAVHEQATISFADSDDPQLSPIHIVDRNAVHGGVAGGLGLECPLDHGLVGLELQYHKVFSSPDRADFVLPKIRFSVAF